MASEHVGVSMVSVTDPSVDDAMGQGACFTELCEPSVLLLESVDDLLQHGEVFDCLSV